MSNRSIINFNNDWHFSKLSGTAFSDVNPSDIKSAEWEKRNSAAHMEQGRLLRRMG